MSKRSSTSAAALALLILCGAAAPARAEITLKVGDAAPALAVGKFVKGQPVGAFEKGKVYVVEFWATWCPPCRESIPHLTTMQKDNPAVTFIGMDAGEDEATVVPFVAKMGDRMDYRVALDDLTRSEEGVTHAAYMTASGEEAIPTAFVVDKEGKVAWIGHPMEMEKPLKQIVGGTYDMRKAIAASAAKAKLAVLVDKQDFDGALKAADEMVAADATMAVELGLMQFQVLLEGKQDVAGATKKAQTLAPLLEDPKQLNELAWALATATATPTETLTLAQTIAESAVEKSKSDPGILDTLARVHAAKKDFPKAVQIQQQAVDKAADPEMKTALAATLKAYQAGKLPDAE